MSLGGAANQALNAAVVHSVDLGILFVVAAGISSPARLGGNPAVITGGATNITDVFASISNSGSNFDVLAPGQDVLSCGIMSDAAAQSRSGTSMTTPHVAGLAALIMGQ